MRTRNSGTMPLQEVVKAEKPAKSPGKSDTAPIKEDNAGIRTRRSMENPIKEEPKAKESPKKPVVAPKEVKMETRRRMVEVIDEEPATSSKKATRSNQALEPSEKTQGAEPSIESPRAKRGRAQVTQKTAPMSPTQPKSPSKVQEVQQPPLVKEDSTPKQTRTLQEERTKVMEHQTIGHRVRNESTTSSILSDSIADDQRGVRKRRKPAAFDDYVDYDLTYPRKAQKETKLESTNTALPPRTPQSPPKNVEKLAPPPEETIQKVHPIEETSIQTTSTVVRTLVRQMPPQQQGNVSNLMATRPRQPPLQRAQPPTRQVTIRTTHTAIEQVLQATFPSKDSNLEVDVDVAENLEITTSSPQVSPRRPAILSRKVHHMPQSPKRPGEPSHAPPPRAAPLLIAGPPRSHGPPPKSALQVLQTQLPKSHPTYFKHKQPLTTRPLHGRFQQTTMEREAYYPSSSRTMPTTRMQQTIKMPTQKFTTTDERMMIQIGERNIFLEPVTIAEGEQPREVYGMYGEDGSTLLGFGIINDRGEFIQEIDGEEVQIVDETVEAIDHSNNKQKIETETKKKSLPMMDHHDEGPENDDDDGPPELEPEVAEVEQPPPPPQHEPAFHDNEIAYDDQEMLGEGEYIDEDAMEYVDGDVAVMGNEGEVRTVEFNFLDKHNIGCGLCGEIVPEELLMTEHLPNAHPEVLGDGSNELEEITYESWLREKIGNEKRSMESGFRALPYGGYVPRATRKVSTVRVCPAEMTLAQLDECLKKKMVEKLGRRVRVSLVDKLHARCGECGAIISLNKKFEIMHLVRHFNAWHPTSHRCAGTWHRKNPQPGMGKPLSLQDFCLADKSLDSTVDNLQCIWCGMLMTKDTLAMHFHEVHAEDIEVPTCRLCIEELVINARLRELYMEDFDITLPDEKHFECTKFNIKTTSEEKLHKAINKRLSSQVGEYDEEEEDDDDEERGDSKPVMNSRMQYGRRNKPKRTFVMPAYRQTAPTNSEYVEAITDTQWRCKKCDFIIMAAVMSAGCISHYKKCHPELHDKLRYELCKMRLEYISDGCMEFVHASLIECLMCHISFALHRPYNMCRAIRHLQKKHPEMMPETQQGAQAGYSQNHVAINTDERRRGARRDENPPSEQIDEAILTDAEIQRLRDVSNVVFDEVQIIPGENGEQVFLLLNEEKVVGRQTQAAIMGGDEGPAVAVRYSGQFGDDDYAEIDPESSDPNKDTPVIIELDEAEYFDDEEAPMPREDGAMFRRLYDRKTYDELRDGDSLRAEPPGYMRRALDLGEEDEFRILEEFFKAKIPSISEYFVPIPDAVYQDVIIEESDVTEK